MLSLRKIDLRLQSDVVLPLLTLISVICLPLYRNGLTLYLNGFKRSRQIFNTILNPEEKYSQ